MFDVIDHRNFLLNMSLTDGQRMASASGHATPDDQGIYLERLDVLRRWAVLSASGCMDVVIQTAAWMTKLLVQPDWDLAQTQSTYSAFLSYAASTIFLLQDEGLISMAHDPIVLLSEYDPETDTATPISPEKYSHRASIAHLDFDPVMQELFDRYNEYNDKYNDSKYNNEDDYE